MVCRPPSLPSSLHAHRRFLAQPDRTLVRRNHPQANPPRGTFRSVPELIKAINDYIRENNKQPKPFIWTVTASSILGKSNVVKKR
jgi:uncharacterized protein (DUF362 family)